MKIIDTYLKPWFKVNLALLFAYFIYDFIRVSITGIPSPIAVEMGQYVGYGIHIWLFWVVVPRFAFRMIKKIFVKSTASAA